MPVGACIAAESAERVGNAVSFLDLMFSKDPLSAVKSEIKKTKPDIVGLSIRNIDNNNMQNPVAFFRELPPIMDVIRGNTHAPVVIGGAAVGVMPEDILRFTGASFAVAERGEIAFPRLLDASSRNENPYQVQGIAWLDNRAFRRNPVKSSPHEYSSPDFKKWIDVDSYYSLQATVPVQSKRGCPHKCVYCTYAIAEGHNYHLYDPDEVVGRIERLVIEGIRDIEFVDNVFNSPYDHAISVCEALINSRLNARFQTLELNPLFIDDTLLTAMERAGFTGIGITAESASNRVLNSLKKGFTSEHVYNAAQCVKRHGLPCVWMFMLGGPGETQDTVMETLKFAEEYIRPIDVAFFNIGIRIYPGTELEHIARRQGVLTLPSHEMFEPVFYLSPDVNIEWLTNKLNAAMAQNFNFINSGSISLPFLSAIYKLSRKFGVKPPLWRHTSFIRRGLRFMGVHA